MANPEHEIGSFEAKTRLSEILREVEGGRIYVILRRGKPVARLVPVEASVRNDFRELGLQFRHVREQVKGPIRVRDLIARERFSVVIRLKKETCK